MIPSARADALRSAALLLSGCALGWVAAILAAHPPPLPTAASLRHGLLQRLYSMASRLSPSALFGREALTLRELHGHLGLDIGGTMAKLVIATHGTCSASAPLSALGSESKCFPTLGFAAVGASCRPSRLSGSFGRGSGSELLRTPTPSVLTNLLRAGESVGESLHLRFISVGTAGLEQAVRKLRPQLGSDDTPEIREVVTAGGGGHKFADMFREVLHVQLVPFKELQAVVDGLLFLSQFGPSNELHCNDEPHGVPWPETLFPFVLVNMGSGVSVLRVDGPQQFTRIGGTSVGGATFLGLSRALTGVSDFAELTALAASGDASKVDKSVGDIYGDSGCLELGMPSDLTAASFAKLAGGVGHAPAQASVPDLIAAALRMVAQVSTVIAIAHAKQIGCMDRVFFVGGFLQNNAPAQEMIAASMRSLGGRALFCRHAPFLGALGSLAASLEAERVRHKPPSASEALEQWKLVRYAHRATSGSRRSTFPSEGAPAECCKLPFCEAIDSVLEPTVP